MILRVKVLLFGPQALLAEADYVWVRLDGSCATVASVFHALRETQPALARTLDQSRVAVNHAYATDRDTVCETDEVALIGMVSGG